MAISSSRAAQIVGNSFSRNELIQLIPAGSSSSLTNYLAFALSANYTKPQLLSATNYLSYVQNFGFTTCLVYI